MCDSSQSVSFMVSTIKVVFMVSTIKVISSPPESGGVRGGLKKRQFRPPPAPPDSGGETVVDVVRCFSMSKIACD